MCPLEACVLLCVFVPCCLMRKCTHNDVRIIPDDMPRKMTPNEIEIYKLHMKIYGR
jgi:hypothetical protein